MLYRRPKGSSKTTATLPTIPFGLILRLPIRYGLPLHVRRSIRPTTLQRPNMIDDVAGTCSAAAARGRTWMLPLEVILGGGTPLDPAVTVALNRVSGSARRSRPVAAVAAVCGA